MNALRGEGGGGVEGEQAGQRPFTEWQEERGRGRGGEGRGEMWICSALPSDRHGGKGEGGLVWGGPEGKTQRSPPN